MPTTIWTGALLPHERVRWEGRPRTGIRFGLADVPMMIFGLFFTAISSLIVVATFPFGILIPHFWVGIYFLGGRFFVERKMRDSTYYAITDSRAIIVRSWPRSKVTTVNLDAVAEMNFTPHSDGTGTISFGGSYSPFHGSGMGHRKPPAFEYVDDAQTVLALAHDAHGVRRGADDGGRPPSSGRFGPPPPSTLEG